MQDLLDGTTRCWSAYRARYADRPHAWHPLRSLDRMGTEHRRPMLATLATAIIAVLVGASALAVQPQATPLPDVIAADGWEGFLRRFGPVAGAGGVIGPIGSSSDTVVIAAAASATVAPPVTRGALPVGKGMWIWQPRLVEGGNPEATIIAAQERGLSHIYVRTGSSYTGFDAQQYLNDILPRAHAAGIRVFGWDFPFFFDPAQDVARAVQAISYVTPTGDRIDGFTADIETRGEGVNINPGTAQAYGSGLRAAVGPSYPLIATVPRPNPALVTYPFATVVEHFDAVAPMVYWLNRQPDSDVRAAVAALAPLGKPVLPIGQAYDGALEGGRPGPPTRDEILRFLHASEEAGAQAVSFWSWQHADAEVWDAIRDALPFTLPATPRGAPVAFSPGQVRLYQAFLTRLGFHVPTSGAWDHATLTAVRAYQAAAGLPTTGIVDHLTRKVLLTPFTIPLGPAAG